MSDFFNAFVLRQFERLLEETRSCQSKYEILMNQFLEIYVYCKEVIPPNSAFTRNMKYIEEHIDSLAEYDSLTTNDEKKNLLEVRQEACNTLEDLVYEHTY